MFTIAYLHIHVYCVYLCNNLYVDFQTNELEKIKIANYSCLSYQGGIPGFF